MIEGLRRYCSRGLWWLVAFVAAVVGALAGECRYREAMPRVEKREAEVCAAEKDAPMRGCGKDALRSVGQDAALRSVGQDAARRSVGKNAARQASAHTSEQASGTLDRMAGERCVRLCFAGDLMVHTPQLTVARRREGYDFTGPFEWVADRFRRSDLGVVNLETTLTDGGRYTGYPLFRSPKTLADALVFMGVDVALLANNHCCDGGGEGIDTTIRELKRRGVAHTGVFVDGEDFGDNHPLMIERGGIRIALLNYTYGTNGMPVPRGRRVNPIDTLSMRGDIARALRLGAECVAVCLHWGVEYGRTPSREQILVGEFLRREGVDLVIGSHPHVVQPVVCDDRGVVAYSLGNFVSNQRQRYSDGGLVLEVEVGIGADGGKRFRTEVTPVWVRHRDYRLIPPEVGDTLGMTADERRAYDLFMDDTRRGVEI